MYGFCAGIFFVASFVTFCQYVLRWYRSIRLIHVKIRGVCCIFYGQYGLLYFKRHYLCTRNKKERITGCEGASNM